MNRAAAVLLCLVLAGCDCRPAATRVALMDSLGQSHEPFQTEGAKAVVLIFLMTDCPVAQATAPELARLFREFEPRGVKFFGVYATQTATEIAEFQKSYQLPFPSLIDSAQQLAKLAGATVVPEAAVFTPDRRLLYRGRVDDRAVSLGTMRPEPTRRDLRLALESVLAGQKVEPQFTQAVGCYLPEH